MINFWYFTGLTHSKRNQKYVPLIEKAQGRARTPGPGPPREIGPVLRTPTWYALYRVIIEQVKITIFHDRLCSHVNNMHVFVINIDE